MQKSEGTKQLALALARAQKEIRPAGRGSENEIAGRKYRYADLAAVWEACRAALSKNNLAVAQLVESGEGGQVIVESILLHSSGEWISGRLAMRPMMDGPQAAGSAITYARRYALAALVGIVAEGEDDDGERAVRGSGQATVQATAKPADPEPAPGVRRELAAPAEAKPAGGKLDPEAVKRVLGTLPRRSAADRVAADLGLLAGALPGEAQQRALAQAWKDGKLQGEAPASREMWDTLPAVSLCLIYAGLFDRLAKFAGYTPPPDDAGAPSSPAAKKGGGKAQASPGNAQGAAPGAAPGAPGDSIDDFLGGEA